MSLLFALLSTPTAQAAKVKLVEGSLEGLAATPKMYVRVDYDELIVGRKRKKISEQDFLATKVSEKEAEEPGSGEKFKTSWEADKTEIYRPRFVELFHKYTEKLGTSLVGDPERAEIFVDIDVTWIYPGFYAGITASDAVADMTVTFRKPGADEPIAVIDVLEAPGDARPRTGDRIGEAFAWTGKYVGKLYAKKAKVK